MSRALALILVLTFATGAVAHAVQASDMALEMAMTADGTMPGCDGCGDHDAAAKLACAPACVAPVVAILGSDVEVVVELTGQSIPPAASERRGRPTLIDPYPPRSSVLI
ncbi:MAG: hypothetical protein RIC85_02320 [Gammaproteobacteria bacterium]